MNPSMDGRLLIISAPSGGGKGTLIKRVLSELPSLAYSVSYTTRKPREGETDGLDYNFVSREHFEELIEKGEFLEHARVHGNYYGTSWPYINERTDAGTDVVLEIDVQGAAQVREKVPESISIFILPPSFSVLKERLILRETESAESLQTRLLNAGVEIRRFNEFDFVIINDEVDRATKDLKSIILSSRLRSDRQTEAIHDILTTFDSETD